MTSPYQVDATPDVIEIRCPKCQGAATFRFALTAFMDAKESRAKAEGHAAYELMQVVMWGNNRRTVAIYYPDEDRRRTLPLDGHSIRYSAGEFANRGSYRCTGCAGYGRHRLDWPRNALFACDVRGKTLWAWTRDHAVVLRDYIQSANRDRSKFRHKFFLMHVPSHFLTAKNRDEAVRKLEQLLA